MGIKKGENTIKPDNQKLDEGVVKFDASDYQIAVALPATALDELNAIRTQLFKLKLIGEYPVEKIGYGNLSVRSHSLGVSELAAQPDNAFVITGTQTGAIETLQPKHYTQVIGFSLQKNAVSVRGPVQASSESLTHAAIYQSNPKINAVIHVHSSCIWNGMLAGEFPATASSIRYGTPEMAFEVQALIANNHFGCFAMAGHQDGVVMYGKSIGEAFKICAELNERFELK